MLDFSESRLPPFQHQIEDTEDLVKKRYFFIASEMRTGKTKIVIDGAQFMYRAGTIDRVIVIGPEPVRGVWYHESLGQLNEHLWFSTSAKITEYHNPIRQWEWGPPSATPLKWIITNYEYIREETRLKPLLKYAGPKTLLVLDESSAVTNHKSDQYKMCKKLRKRCGRVVLLDGTPFETPLNLFALGNMLHESILDCGYITHFRARYAQMGGWRVGAVRKVLPDGKVVFEGGRPTQVVGWVNLEDLQQRFAPYTVRRLQKDCKDMPEKLPPVTIPVPLTERTWAAYKQMRDDMIVELEGGNVSIAMQAITEKLRLAQITSGFLGGVVDSGLDDEDDVVPMSSVQEIGREKLQMVLWLIGQQLQKDPFLKIIVWCRFRPEAHRLLAAVAQMYPQMIVAALMGGQTKKDRQRTKDLLHPDSTPKDQAIFVCGTYGTGSFGLDFSASHTNVNCSYDYGLRKFLQSGDRVYGPNQKHPVSYFDLVATGPKGQKTIDHIIVSARRNKWDLALWTTSAWVKALKEE